MKPHGPALWFVIFPFILCSSRSVAQSSGAFAPARLQSGSDPAKPQLHSSPQAHLRHDDPELYFGFLSLAATINADVSAMKNQSSIQSARRGVAETFGLNERDCNVLLASAAPLLVQIRTVADSPEGDMPARRVARITSVVGQLKSLLSPEGWSALNRYVTQEYRGHVVSME